MNRWMLGLALPLLVLFGACSSNPPVQANPPIYNPPPATVPKVTLVLTPVTPRLEVGQTLTLEARIDTLKITPMLWSSSLETVATVDNQGLVLARTPGQTKVCA